MQIDDAVAFSILSPYYYRILSADIIEDGGRRI